MTCRQCHRWGNVDDERRRRSLRLCRKSGRYTSADSSCEHSAHRDAQIQKMMDELHADKDAAIAEGTP